MTLLARALAQCPGRQQFEVVPASIQNRPPVRAWTGIDRRGTDSRYLELVRANAEQAATIYLLRQEINRLNGIGVADYNRIEHHIRSAEATARLCYAEEGCRDEMGEVVDHLSDAAGALRKAGEAAAAYRAELEEARA